MIFEAYADEAAFGVAVARAKREIPNAVEDRPPSIDLERLQDVRMMADYDVGAAVDREACLGAVFSGRSAIVRNSPVEGHDNAIRARPQ